jgi:hypothetical protein
LTLNESEVIIPSFVLLKKYIRTTMTEQKLKEYFESKLTADQLTLDLEDSQQKLGCDSTAVYIGNLNEGEFEIKTDHLIKLLDDAIANKLQPIDLNTIGFALMTSEYFDWDGASETGERISTVIFELDNPEIGYDLTIKNLQLWKAYLLTGEYRLDKNELKQKFRSNGKYLELYQKVDEILWNDWDPIGVNDVGPRDEYQGYTPTIFNLIKKDTDKETIAQKLLEFEIQNIGLIGNIEHCRQVADKLISQNVTSNHPHKNN